jgi:hypothetical protein
VPYKTVGNKVYHFKNGRWSVKQVTGSKGNAKKALRLLNAVEYGGWKPTKKGK